jgi:hypothetical protein
MRYLLLALALTFTFTPASPAAANKPVKVKATRGKFKQPKIKKIKPKKHAGN